MILESESENEYDLNISCCPLRLGCGILFRKMVIQKLTKVYRSVYREKT